MIELDTRNIFLNGITRESQVKVTRRGLQTNDICEFLFVQKRVPTILNKITIVQVLGFGYGRPGMFRIVTEQSEKKGRKNII